MLVSSAVHCLAVLIFQLCGVKTLSPITSCPVPCVCENSSVINCASLSLSTTPTHIPATSTALDLSHNALHSLAPLGSGRIRLHRLQHLHVGNNSLKILSMCSGIRGTLTTIHQRCVSWAPDLQSLSADRNQLKCLPRGLGNIKSLKVLQLSHNRISEIGPADLAGCAHLFELKIHHNLITNIHPQAFKDLQELKILDLSHNLLTTIPVPAYLSLRNLNTLVGISGNRWRCDCNLKTIRRWLSFDRELGNPAWDVVCFSPSNHAGKDLLYLQESDLPCPQSGDNTPGVKEVVTVDEGKDFILSCSTDNRDFMHTRWWTPRGQISHAQQFLHISNATEYDAGLYVCVSGSQTEHVSIFTVRVRKRAHDKRLRREAESVPGDPLNRANDDYMQRNVPAVRTVQQPHFVLAVCLSVFITFVVAFVLGVVLRPYLEKWYKQSFNKRNSNTPPSNLQTSSTRPYVNEGYSDTDDGEYEGPRVIFGVVTENREHGSVPYYVTVQENQSGNDTSGGGVYENVETGESFAENIEVHKEVPLGEENTERRTERSNEMRFEYIPDPEDNTEFEERSISPASSVLDALQQTQASCKARESAEQSVDSPTVTMDKEEGRRASTDHQATIPGFITDPFPLKVYESQEMSVDELDPDSGDSFSFTEGSPRSSSRVLHVAELQKEMSVDEVSDRRSSCESEESEGGFTEYTVNPEDHDRISFSDDDIKRVEQHIQTKEPGSPFRQDTITLDSTDIYMTYPRGDSFDDEYKEYFSSSAISNDREDEPRLYNVHPVYRPSQKTTSQIGEDTDSSSYSEDEENKQGDYPRRLEVRLEHGVPSTDATPARNPDRILSIDYDNSSSSTDIEDKSGKDKDRGIFKGLSAMLFNRSGSENNKKAVQTEAKTASTNSKGTGGFMGISFKKQPATPSDNTSPTPNEDHFFATMGQAFDRIPKLKKSLLFSSSVPKPANQQESTFITDRISESPRSNVSPFFDGIFEKNDPTLDPIPHVKRSLHFSHNQPYEEASVEQVIFEEVVKKDDEDVVRLESVPKTESPFDQFNIYFEGQSTSLKAIPKVQRYVEFRQLEPQNVQDLTPNFKEDSFFEQIPISFDEVPKVKQYLQFSPSETNRSNVSTPSTLIEQIVRPESVPKTESQLNTINVFFGGQTTSIQAIPKVHRYVEFSQTEPQNVQELTPPFTEDSFFEQIPISFHEVPKVKQYLQFSPSISPQPNLTTPPVSVNQIVRPESVPKSESPSNTFSIFFGGQSLSLQAIPKVHRYVEFRQLEPQTVQELMPNIKEDSFLGQIPISFDEVPKVKQYLQFSPSESPQANLTTHPVSVNQVVKLESVPKPESNTFNIFFEGQSISLQTIPKVHRYIQCRRIEPQTVQKLTPTINRGCIFGQIPISFDEVPKVKRHLLFSQSEPHYQASSTDHPIKKKYSVPDEQITPSLVTNVHVHAQPRNTGDHFFEEIPISLSGVPKVKKYIHFTQPEKVTEKHFPFQETIPTVQIGAEVKRNNLASKESNPVVDQHNFFGQIGLSFDELPKVKRRIHFTEHSPRPPEPQPLSSLKQPVTSHSISDSEARLAKPHFFEGIHVSLDNIPKVKRSLQFTKNEAEPPNQPIPSFFGQIEVSLDKVPKVKRYLQVIKSEPPSPSTSGITEFVKSQRPEAEASPSIKGDDFFGQIDASFDGIPKVNRHIQFTQTEPRTQTLHSLTNRIENPIHTASNLQSADRIQPATGEHGFFGPIGEIPKVKRHIQFSERFTDSSSLPLHRQTDTPVLTKSELQMSSSRNEDPFFKKNDALASGLPKVKRYIQFTDQHSMYLNTNEVTADEAKKTELLGTVSSVVDFQTPPTQDKFFGQIGTNFNALPRVNRYIQFTQSEPPSQSPSTSAITERLRPEILTKTQSARSETHHIKEDDFFGHIGASFNGLPKVTRYLKFTQSEPSQSQSLTEEMEKKQTTISSLTYSDTKSSTNGALSANTPFKQYNPHHLPPSISYQKWEAETESSVFKTSPASVGDYSPEQTSTKAKKSYQFDPNQALSQIQDTPSSIRVNPETSSLKLKSSPFLSNLDIQPDQEDVVKQTGSNSSSGDKINANTQRSSSWTPVSPTDPENMETKMSSAWFSESDPLRTRKRLVIDPALVAESQPDSSAASPGRDDAREYLRDSSLARQRQERRRLLFQQKKRAMGGFSLNSESFTSQESDQ